MDNSNNLYSEDTSSQSPKPRNHQPHLVETSSKDLVYAVQVRALTPLTQILTQVAMQKVPVIFLSYCVSKLLMWILVPLNDEIVMKCQSIELKGEELENISFELYIRYNLLQFLSKDEIYIFRRCAYEQESPFTLLHDVIAIKIIEGVKSVGFSEVTKLYRV